MRKPRLLDLFCGAGGCSAGYHQAGFEVVGVDLVAQRSYPFEFRRADALTFPLDGFDVIHASPPCQAFSLAAAGGVRRAEGHLDLIAEIRSRLQEQGVPYIIENVPQAPLHEPMTLCGTSFGLPIIRHRAFESSVPIFGPSCGYAPTARVRHANYLAYPYGRKSWGPAWRQYVIPQVWPWMTLAEAGQAIPPVYTKWIGCQLISVNA